MRLRLGVLSLEQPERHIHGAVEADSSGQFGMCWLRPTTLGIQGTETEAAMCLERAHAQPLGMRQRFSVVRFGLMDVGRAGVGMDGTEPEQRICLCSTQLQLPRQVERLTGLLPGPCAPSLGPAGAATPLPGERHPAHGSGPVSR